MREATGLHRGKRAPSQGVAEARVGAATLAEMAHEARNLTSALELYCELLSRPGVLMPDYREYAEELRLVSAASRSLLRGLGALQDGGAVEYRPPVAVTALPGTWCGAEPSPGVLIADFAAALRFNARLMQAIAGPGVRVELSIDGGALQVSMTEEDLTRLLVNLTRNAVEAMENAGTIELTLTEHLEGAACVRMAMDDSGPGVPAELRATIFQPGYTTRAVRTAQRKDGSWPPVHRGLGLSIVRSLVEGAGGRIDVSAAPEGGARFEVELPIRRH